MGVLSPTTIGRRLVLLVAVAVLPAAGILLVSGLELRRHTIEDARQELQLMAHAMAGVQQDVTASARQLLSTLALLPQVRGLDRAAAQEIFEEVLARNPDYLNITLTDPRGEVLASGRPMTARSLGDRKHVRDAVARAGFAVGEYIISRVGSAAPAFAYACPVVDRDGGVAAVLTAPLQLANIARFHELSDHPEGSFVAVTDHRGIRLFYHPPRASNPVGQPIAANAWDAAAGASGPGITVTAGSDGVRRIIAFEPVRLDPGDAPYLYVWAGAPEALVLAPANAALARNLLLLLVATLGSFLVAGVLARTTMLAPIRSLVALTKRFSAGDFAARADVPESAGELGALTRSFHDMADALARSQGSLRESERRFRLLMDSLEALVYVADMETHEILFINEYGKRAFGDVTGRICWQAMQEGQRGPCPFCTNRHLLDGDGRPREAYTWEFRNTRTGRHFQIRDRAIRWVDGRLVRLEVATDITERTEAEARLAEETERLSVTLRSIGDGVITTDTRGRVVLLNAVAEALTGWRAGDAAGRPLGEVFRLVDSGSRRPCASPAEAALASGAVASLPVDALLLARDGTERRVADSAAPIRDGVGEIVGAVIVFRDVTERLRTERELLKVRQLESLGVLAGGIAHDFNNILAAILGNVDLALEDGALGAGTRALLAEAGKASLAARDLARQLLTFARGGEPIREAASLGEVIRDSAGFVLRGDSVACRFEIPDDLWLVDIDRAQVSQVIQNLVLNASQAMPSGGTITISCENALPSRGAGAAGPAGRSVAIRIRDTGPGMPPEVLEKIFDPYFSTREGGTGLGLAITRSIVLRHGGEISVASAPGVGTTFTILLPASEAAAVRPGGASAAARPAAGARVLVMDDEEMVRAVSGEMLARLGHEALLAASGEEAVRRYREATEAGRPFDVVLTDLTVPGGMGGRETAAEILRIDPGARLVVSSGYSGDPVLANHRDFGFRAAIVKPFQLRDLERVLGEVLGDGAA